MDDYPKELSTFPVQTPKTLPKEYLNLRSETSGTDTTSIPLIYTSYTLHTLSIGPPFRIFWGIVNSPPSNAP